MGWIILGSVILLLVILLSLSLSFELNIEEQADFKLRYAIFSIFPRPTGKDKPNRSKAITINKPKDKKVSEDNKIDENSEPPAQTAAKKLSTAPPKSKPKKAKQKVDFVMIKSVIDSMGHPLKKLVGKIRVTEFYIKSTIAEGDAAKTAIKYGLHCATINTAVAWLKATVKLKIKDICVNADFDGEESDFFLHCKIKIRVFTLIVCVIAFFAKYLNKKEGI